MQSRSPMNSAAAAWLVSSTRTNASAGRSALVSASRSTAAMARFDWIAPDDPRRNAAFPDLRHRPNASLVTLGRFS